MVGEPVVGICVGSAVGVRVGVCVLGVGVGETVGAYVGICEGK